MKNLILIAVLLVSTSVMAKEKVFCRAEKAVHPGFDQLKAEVDISFELNRTEKAQEIKNVLGHIFVQAAYGDSDEMSTENAYMGFFKIDSLKANPNYRPIKYKGFVQFKDFDATHSTGVEDGMWGTLVLDILKGKEFSAKYIFQAGDHMGGTVLLNCKEI